MGIFKRKRKIDDVIDLRDEAVQGDAHNKPMWGFPSRCPECRDYGYLDHLDSRAGIMYQHCPTCYAKWETHRSETSDVIQA